MILAAGNIADILTALRCDRGVGDHRRAPRVGLRARVTIVPYDDGRYGQPAEVWVRNLSAGGIGLLHSEALRQGQMFLVRLPSQGKGTVSLLCTVAHSQQVAGHLFRIGAKFTSEPFNESQQAPAGANGVPVDYDDSDIELSRLRRLIRSSKRTAAGPR